MLSEACFEVSEALSTAGIRPAAVERALNVFGDAMDLSSDAATCNPAILRALRQGRVAAKRGALSPDTFAEMAKAVHRHLDRHDTLTDAALVELLDKRNLTARAHVRTLPAGGESLPLCDPIKIKDVVDVLVQRGGSIYPHALKTGLANQFPSASADEVNEAYERALSSYALIVTPMGKICRYPRE